MSLLEKAKVLADYTQSLASGSDWGISDQDILEWLIAQVEDKELLSIQEKEAIKDARDCMRWMTPCEDSGILVEDICSIKEGTFDKRREQIKLLDEILAR